MSHLFLLAVVVATDLAIAWAVSLLRFFPSRLLTAVARLFVLSGLALGLLRATGGPLDSDMGDIAVGLTMMFVVIPIVLLATWMDWLRAKTRRTQVYGMVAAIAVTYTAGVAASFDMIRPSGV